jgi:hypothetical protein
MKIFFLIRFYPNKYPIKDRPLLIKLKQIIEFFEE